MVSNRGLTTLNELTVFINNSLAIFINKSVVVLINSYLALKSTLKDNQLLRSIRLAHLELKLNRTISSLRGESQQRLSNRLTSCLIHQVTSNGVLGTRSQTLVINTVNNHTTIGSNFLIVI